MNSSVELWPSAAASEVSAVRTTIPSIAVSVAAGLELRHALDLDEAHPAGADRRPEPRLVAEDGISIPAASAVSTSPVPLGT